MEIAHRTATEPPPDLRDAWPGAPAGAAEALRRGMAREASDRPASAGELVGALERGLAEDRTASTLLAPRRAQRRRVPGWVPAVAAAGAVALVGGAALVAFGGADDTAPQPEAKREQPRAQPSKPRTIESAPREPAPAEPAPAESAASTPTRSSTSAARCAWRAAREKRFRSWSAGSRSPIRRGS
jgi:hypothetical protein